MESAELIVDALERISRTLARGLSEMKDEDLRWQPSADTNPMGWLAWHLTRIQDDHLSALAGREQAWTADGWHARFDMDSDDKDRGWGHTSEQVSAFRSPDAQMLLDYHAAVLARSKAYLATLSSGDLDRVLDEPQWKETVTVGIRLVSVISDNMQHAGQIAYVRGLRHGLGWQGA